MYDAEEQEAVETNRQFENDDEVERYATVPVVGDQIVLTTADGRTLTAPVSDMTEFLSDLNNTPGDISDDLAAVFDAVEWDGDFPDPNGPEDDRWCGYGTVPWGSYAEGDDHVEFILTAFPNTP